MNIGLAIVLAISLFVVSPSWAARGFKESTSDRVQSPASAAWDVLTAGSWSFWVYRTANMAGVLLQFADADDGNVDSGWTIDSRATNPNTVQLNLVYGTSNLRARSTNSLTLDSWVHVGITWTGGALCAAVSIYFDGVVETNVCSNEGSGGRFGENMPLAIGNNNSGGSVSVAANMADFAIWDVELTAAEVSQLAGRALPTEVRGASLVYFNRLCGRQTPEPDAARASHGVVTGTAEVAHPPQVAKSCLRQMPVRGVG